MLDVAPTLNLVDQAYVHNTTPEQVALDGQDGDAEEVFYTATIQQDELDAYNLKVAYGIGAYFPTYDNWQGDNEKWMGGNPPGPPDQLEWFYIKPDLTVWQWDSGGPDTQIGTLAQKYYDDPTLWENQEAVTLPPVTLSITGDTSGKFLNIQWPTVFGTPATPPPPPDAYTGQFTIDVEATDNTYTVTDSFQVTVTNAPPVLALPDILMSQNTSAVVNLPHFDADGDEVFYSVQVKGDASDAYAFKTAKNLGAYYPGWDNWYGQN
jgi:hypothetical protein